MLHKRLEILPSSGVPSREAAAYPETYRQDCDGRAEIRQYGDGAVFASVRCDDGERMSGLVNYRGMGYDELCRGSSGVFVSPNNSASQLNTRASSTVAQGEKLAG